MLIVEHIKLDYRQNFISTEKVRLDLFEHESGHFVLSANLKSPNGIGYFITTESLFNLFLSDVITLQDLFDMSPSVFIEVMQDSQVRLYLRYDVDIILESGDKKFSSITGSKSNLYEKPQSN